MLAVLAVLAAAIFTAPASLLASEAGSAAATPTAPDKSKAKLMPKTDLRIGPPYDKNTNPEGTFHLPSL